MESFIFFLLGIVASILTNLATPFIQKWLEGTMLVNKSKRLKALREELEQTSHLYTNASKFTATIAGDIIFLITLLMVVLTLGSFAIYIQAVALQMRNFSVFTFLGYTASSKSTLINLSYTFHQAAWIAMQIAFVIMSVFIMFVIRILRKIRKVKDYEQYKLEVEQRIQTLEISSIKQISQN